MKMIKKLKSVLILSIFLTTGVFILVFFTQKNLINQNKCSHTQSVCDAVSRWSSYKNSEDYSTSYEIMMTSGELRKSTKVRNSNGLVKISHTLNNNLESEIIMNEQQAFELNTTTNTYKKNNTLLSNLYYTDSVRYSQTSSSQKLTTFIMENSNLFSFQDLGNEECAGSDCKKFQVTIATNTTPQDLINNGMDKYSAENLKHNDIYLWIDLNTYRVHRIRSEYQDTYRDLTYDYNPPQINIPQ